jgi:hypothetical protein
MTVIVTFPDKKMHNRALGFLIARCSGKSWATGEMAIPAWVLPELAVKGIKFSVLGPARYEHLTPLCNKGPLVV